MLPAMMNGTLSPSMPGGMGGGELPLPRFVPPGFGAMPQMPGIPGMVPGSLAHMQAQAMRAEARQLEAAADLLDGGAGGGMPGCPAAR